MNQLPFNPRKLSSVGMNIT